MKYYVVRYKGTFGFIKPWSAVRDGMTCSQQFLTPSIIEGIEKKLFPELLVRTGKIMKILRHKLVYQGMSDQQEQTQARGFNNKGGRDKSILVRGVLINPCLSLAFADEADAVTASRQHICLCRNEDILLPQSEIEVMDETDFDQQDGFELRFGQSENSFLVGYNRFDNAAPMYGWIEYNGTSLL